MPWDSGTWDSGFWDSDSEPPPFTPTQPQKRTRHMPKADYIESADEAFVAQLRTFKENIGSYATLLGVTPAQVTAQAADADYMAYVQDCQQAVLQAGQQWSAWKRLVRGGGTAPPTGIPVLPVFPDAVAAVALGIEIRFRALCQQIKKSPAYNVGIGEALGIEGAMQTPPPAGTLQPVIDLLIDGNKVLVKWGWQGKKAFIDMCEIQVDRADGKGWVLLAYDTTPDYLDTAPFPDTPARWKYRAIYHKGDTQVGNWSDEKHITVG